MADFWTGCAAVFVFAAPDEVGGYWLGDGI